jgi:ATP-dependent Clp protease ATP-binding subunit ClpX
MLTDAATKDVARITLERGTGARGLRSVIEEVLEPVMFEVEAGVRFVITEKTVSNEEAVRQSLSVPMAPLSAQVLRRLMVRKSS